MTFLYSMLESCYLSYKVLRINPPKFFSICSPTLKSDNSFPFLLISCIPIGSLFLSKPIGIVKAGSHQTFAYAVYGIYLLYIFLLLNIFLYIFLFFNDER